MIVEETTSMMTLQCLMQQPFTSPEKILQRNQASTIRMIRDAVSSFVDFDMDLAKNVIERDVENNKFYFLLVTNSTYYSSKSPPQRETCHRPHRMLRLPFNCRIHRRHRRRMRSNGTNTLELDGTKLSEELRKLLLELQSTCCEANENAFKSFLSKDISLAENVRNLRVKIDDNCSRIEVAAKDSSVDLMPQILAAVSFLRQIYERSVDMADLVV